MKKHVISFFVTVLLLTVVNVSGQMYPEEVNHVLQTSVDDYLYGSMVIPPGDSASTVVLLISDGGVIDRDGNTRTYRNNCLQKLAYTLAAFNIASLRYDKRGVAASRISSSSSPILFDDYVRDAGEWINLLRRDGRFRHIVVLGHGQGGLIAMAALSKPGTKADGLILVNCDSHSYDDVIKDRYSKQSFLVKDVVYSIVDSLKNGYDVDFVPVFLSSTLAPARQNFVRSLMSYDPLELLHSMKMPSLIIGGETDIEVSSENAVRLSGANKRSKYVVVSGMNHVMKDCYTMDRDFQVLTYANPAKPLNRSLVEILVSFTNSINK